MAHDVSKPAASAIQLKRAYAAPAPQDGARVLVDRLWARGIAKTSADLDAWMAELGPTNELRTWFGHQPDRWTAFAAKYRKELTTPLRQTLLAALQGAVGESTLTLVYGARDTKQNEAVVLRDLLLHEKPKPPAAWDAATRLLAVAAAVAAAQHDAVASAPVVHLFISSLLSKGAFDGALEELLTGGQLREATNGWKLTARGKKQAHHLSQPEAASGISS